VALPMRIAAAKLVRKLHKKGAAGDRPPNNFRDKTNVSVEASVRCDFLFIG